jgi:hypothetical protein
VLGLSGRAHALESPGLTRFYVKFGCYEFVTILTSFGLVSYSLCIEWLSGCSEAVHAGVGAEGSSRTRTGNRVVRVVSVLTGPIATRIKDLALALEFLYVVLLATGAISLPSGGSSATRHGRNPYEYLYLDSARVDAYLGQLNEGNVKTEERTENHTTAAGAELQVDTVGKATASTSSERKNSAVVTLTEADNFYRLLGELRSEASLRMFDMQSPGLVGELGAVSDGTMVVLTDTFLEAPPYLSAYPALRYASYRITSGDEVFGPAPLTAFSASEPALDTEAKAQRAAFIKNAGENPRLPLTVSPQGMTVVIPARFANITGDVSLFGTRLSVMGKVVFSGERFGDGASVATYLPALLRASSGFLRDLGVRKAFLHEYDQALRSHSATRVRAVQDKVFNALSRSLSFGRTVEIIPVAIYD